MLQPLFRPLILAFAALAVTWGGLSIAQEPKEEAMLPELPLPVPVAPKADVSDTAEQKRLVSLGEALAASNQELETLREQHEQLKLQMEALGVVAIKGDERSLQQRMLKAVADLRSAEKDRVETIEKLNRLAEAAAAYSSKPGEAALKSGLDDALKAARTSKKSASPEAVALEAARVVSYKADLGLAVINAGRQSGVRMGTPLRVIRADRTVATGLIVDVRDRISGLLITGDAAAAVRAGDAVKPELTQNSPKQ